MKRVVAVIIFTVMAVSICSYGQELSPVMGLNEKWGFVDGRGIVVIPFKYEAVQEFSEGLAAVKLHKRWGFIDTTGNKIIPFIYYDVGKFSEGVARIRSEYDNPKEYGLVVIKAWRFIDKTGQEVIRENYKDAGDFSEGLARVKRDKKWGFINNTGKTIIAFKYDDASDFSGGTARVKIKSDWNLIDQTGEVALEQEVMGELKKCPYCGEEILAVAIKCKHCGEWLDKTTTNRTSKKQPTTKNSQGVTIEKPFKGVALGVNVLTGFGFKGSYMDVGFGARLSYTFSVPIRLAGEFDVLWGIPSYESFFVSIRLMDYGVYLQYLFSGKGKRFAGYPLVGLGGVNFNVKERVTEDEFGLSLNRFMFTLGYGIEGLSKNGKFFYGFGMRFKIAKLNIGPYKIGTRVHTVVGIGYKF